MTLDLIFIINKISYTVLFRIFGKFMKYYNSKYINKLKTVTESIVEHEIIKKQAKPFS
jgi:hypothetical protein